MAQTNGRRICMKRHRLAFRALSATMIYRLNIQKSQPAFSQVSSAAADETWGTHVRTDCEIGDSSTVLFHPFARRKSRGWGTEIVQAHAVEESCGLGWWPKLKRG